MIGPGKYDDIATLVRTFASADGVIVVVIGGWQGSGFSVQASAEITARLPELLRTLAESVERDLKG